MSSSFIAALRLLILLLAAGAVVSAFALASRREGAEALSRGLYVCPMHPQVTAEAPGTCAICGMGLAPDRAREAPTHDLVPVPAEISLVRRHLVTQGVRSHAWVASDGEVDALIYNEDLAALGAHERGSFLYAAAPNAGLTVERTTKAPSVWDASASQVRFAPDAHAPALRPGDVGLLILAPKAHEVLVAPVTAVLQAPEGPYVLVSASDGSEFAMHRVTIGKVVGGFAVVLSGIRDQERVIARDAFFLDAERRLHGL
jgi:hypothetical protein